MDTPTAEPAPAQDVEPPASPKRRRRRRVWPWVVGAVVVVVVAALAAPVLLHRPSASSGYLTAKAETRSVALTAQGTGSVVDTKVVAIATDGSWAVTARAGVGTGVTLQGPSVTVDKVDVKVGDAVKKGDALATVTDAAGTETTVEAPSDGVVLTVSADKKATAVGELFTLGVGGVRVASDISEYDIGSVATGQTVQFSFEGLGVTGRGTVQSIGPAAPDQSQTQTTSTVTSFPVVAAISSPPKGLRVGMSVQTTIDVEHVDDVLAVPVQALTETAAGEYTVTVVGARGATRTVDVTVGLIGDSHAEITGGLSAGDAVVIGTAATGASETTTGFPNRQGTTTGGSR